MNEMAPPESCRSLWYIPTVNRFKDDTGAILNDLTPLFPTWKIDVWKKGKDYGLMKDKTGEVWELFYDVVSQYCECKHHCNVCSGKCEIYDLIKDEYAMF